MRSKKEAIVEDEPNLSLASRNKGKGKHGPSSGREVASGIMPTKDMSKIKCYFCGEIGHYASQFPNAKKGKGAKGKEQQQVAIQA